MDRLDDLLNGLSPTITEAAVAVRQGQMPDDAWLVNSGPG